MFLIDTLIVTNLQHIYIFFFKDTPTTEIYTLSLHDALPILRRDHREHDGLRHRDEEEARDARQEEHRDEHDADAERDRKSTRLNSSHRCISYAVFCLKKKKKKKKKKKITI